MEENGTMQEWEIVEYSAPLEDIGETAINYDENKSKLGWILNSGVVSLGKKVVVTGFVISISVPLLVVISALALPFGAVYASYACTDKLMSKLLLPPAEYIDQTPEYEQERVVNVAAFEYDQKEEEEEEEIREMRSIEVVEDDIIDNHDQDSSKINEPNKSSLAAAGRDIELIIIKVGSGHRRLDQEKKKTSTDHDDDYPENLGELIINAKAERQQQTPPKPYFNLMGPQPEDTGGHAAKTEDMNINNVGGSREDVTIGKYFAENEKVVLENTDNSSLIDQKEEKPVKEMNNIVKVHDVCSEMNIDESTTVGHVLANDDDDDKKIEHRTAVTTTTTMMIYNDPGSENYNHESKKAIAGDGSGEYTLERAYNSSSTGMPADQLNLKHDDDDEDTCAVVHSDEGLMFGGEEIWKKMEAIRVIVGYKGGPRRRSAYSSYVEELKALYLFTGIEPPPSDSAEFHNSLCFLMSVIGLKYV